MSITVYQPGAATIAFENLASGLNKINLCTNWPPAEKPIIL